MPAIVSRKPGPVPERISITLLMKVTAMAKAIGRSILIYRWRKLCQALTKKSFPPTIRTGKANPRLINLKIGKIPSSF